MSARTGGAAKRSTKSTAAKKKARSRPKKASAEAKARAEKLKARPRSSATQAARDALVAELREQGVQWSEIVAMDGRTERQLRRVVSAYKQAPSPLNQRPMATTEAILRRFDLAWKMFAELALDADSDATRIGGIKGMLQVEKDRAELLMALGHLPTDLTAMRSEAEMIRIGEEMADCMDDLAEGKITVQDAREFFLEVIQPAERVGV